MDPRKNPYAPGAGTKPPALVGRDDQIESFDVLLERLENGYAEKSMIITGLRGVGKTVLLDVFREKAEDRDWATVEWEVEKNAPYSSGHGLAAFTVPQFDKYMLRKHSNLHENKE